MMFTPGGNSNGLFLIYRPTSVSLTGRRTSPQSCVIGSRGTFRTRCSSLIPSVFALVLPTSLSADGNRAPVVKDPLHVRSVSRPSAWFHVSPTIVLVAEDPDTVSSEMHITHAEPAHGRVVAVEPSVSEPPGPPGRRMFECHHQPEPGYTGADSFVYTVDHGTHYTDGAVLTKVEPGGLRWEIETSGSTGLSDDKSAVLGKTGLGLVFRLDWQPLASRKGDKKDHKEKRPFLLEQPVALGSSRLSRAAHVVFMTGIVSRPLAVKQASPGTENGRVIGDGQDDVEKSSISREIDATTEAATCS